MYFHALKLEIERYVKQGDHMSREILLTQCQCGMERRILESGFQVSDAEFCIEGSAENFIT